jgi:lipid-binding SYLF domain-containing protein
MKTFHLIAAAAAAALSLCMSATSLADSKEKIDREVMATVVEFRGLNPSNSSLGKKASGMLVFPEVTKAGVAVAGEYGEGALQVNGKTIGYYSIGAASVGLTLGVAKRSEIIMFMTKESLDKFTRSDGWSVGADAGITVMKSSANGEYDSKTQQKPILAFVFGEKGLIGDLSLEGAKITKLVR